MKYLLLAALAGAVLMTSCKKDDPTPTTPEPTANVPFVEIASATTSSNKTVTLYAESGTLEAGYTPLYVQVKDGNGTAIDNATVTFDPLMTMTSMSHSSPLEQPIYNATSNYYEGAVVFTMASTAGTWTLGVDVDGETVTFNLDIAEPATKMVGSYLGTDNESYIVALVRPNSWTVGLNDFEIVIYHKASMMSFPADDAFTVLFEPEMISMQHSSPNNVAPVATGNGHYAGTVNYTMTGDWRLHFELQKNGVTIVQDAYVDILF